jgi:hypothetical protein
MIKDSYFELLTNACYWTKQDVQNGVLGNQASFTKPNSQLELTSKSKNEIINYQFACKEMDRLD